MVNGSWKSCRKFFSHEQWFKFRLFLQWTFCVVQKKIVTVPVNSPHKGQWRGSLMFSLICGWMNSWVNNHEAGDLTHIRAHYDVTVMRRNWHHSNCWFSMLFSKHIYMTYCYTTVIITLSSANFETTFITVTLGKICCWPQINAFGITGSLWVYTVLGDSFPDIPD